LAEADATTLTESARAKWRTKPDEWGDKHVEERMETDGEMKRLPFWGLNLLVYLVWEIMEGALIDPYTGLYVSDAAVLIDLSGLVVGLYVVFMAYQRRAQDAGLVSNWHGLWCFVPFAILWFGFVPTGFHNAGARQ
jgi:hypothetical protein